MSIKLPSFQPRMVELGRIRMGDKAATKSGGQRPNKLDHWRLTSPHREPLDAAAELYGGSVREWQDPSANPPRQFELYTETETLRVVMPAVTQFEQYLEKWDRGGCTVRTDGEWDFLNQRPWTGPTDKEGLEAAGIKPTTRLSVMLEGVPGFGVWRLEVHGYYAAIELAGAMVAIEHGGLTGQFSAGELTIAQRQSKRGGETKRYVTPVLVINRTPEELARGAAHVAALDSGELPALPTVIPKGIHAPSGFDPDDPFALGESNPLRDEPEEAEIVEDNSAKAVIERAEGRPGRKSEISQAIEAAGRETTRDWAAATASEVTKALRANGLDVAGTASERAQRLIDAGVA